MIKKTTIETQLNCKATASLSEEILKDLSQPDRAMAELISTEDKEEKDESKNNEQDSD